ncbi:hypothetical protein Cgig2_033187 [Carnegiea gigantea]|uniref:Uncharacterized protein n=1 Tax=Carnegiea gigantea TaxID=171969 RepID=A0A9Q1JUK5_9CARY|nr:hypothetical protein Cgig2_033187 [Carnegiea gigantea]
MFLIMLKTVHNEKIIDEFLDTTEPALRMAGDQMAEHGLPVQPKDPQDPPPAPGSPQGGDLPVPSPPAPELLIDDEGYDTHILYIWAGDNVYYIWGEKDDDGASDSDSVISMINIPNSPEIIEISSEEEDSWTSGSETSNSSDPDYQPRGWNQRRKREG